MTLIVDLVAPDGTVFNLLNRSGRSADNVDQTFTVNLGATPANGTWNRPQRPPSQRKVAFAVRCGQDTFKVTGR